MTGARAGAFALRRGRRVSGEPPALRRIASLGVFAVVPVAVTALVLYALVGHGFALDYHEQFWPAGRRVLDGLSPYDLGWQDIEHQIAFPYGAVPALLFAPFALLPHAVADAVYTGLLIATVPLTLWLLEVRDWRVYGLSLLWVPVLEAWGYANVSLLLALGIALLWRCRDRAPVAGALFALLVCIKLLVWPLMIWLAGTRRYGALAYALLAGLALNGAAWFVIGFDQVGPYVKLLGLVSDEEERRSYSVMRLGLDLGAGRAAAYALTFGLGAALGVACFLLARRGGERSALLLCVAMMSFATPVTWPHYWALMIVPIALLRPRLSAVWAIPVVMAPILIAAPGTGTQAPAVAAANVVFAVLVAAALLPRSVGQQHAAAA